MQQPGGPLSIHAGRQDERIPTSSLPLAAEVEPAQQQQLLSSVLNTLKILYVDGTIAEL